MTIFKAHHTHPSPTDTLGAHLYGEAELLKALEQSFFIAGHKGLQVGVDDRTHLRRLLLDLQLDAEVKTGVRDYIEIFAFYLK